MITDWCLALKAERQTMAKKKKFPSVPKEHQAKCGVLHPGGGGTNGGTRVDTDAYKGDVPTAEVPQCTKDLN